MDFEHTSDYKKVKEAILCKYEINKETYRLRFRASTVLKGETPKELQARLKDLYEKCMMPKQKTKEEIGDTIVLEQFLDVLNPELRTWIQEHNPASSIQAAELADAFIAARRTYRGYQPGQSTRTFSPSSKPEGVWSLPEPQSYEH